MTSTKAMARLFLWEASHVMGTYSNNVTYMCGAALAHRVLGLQHDEGFFHDAVQEVQKAIDTKHIVGTAKEAEQFLATLTIPSDLYDKYAQEAHTLVQDNETVFNSDIAEHVREEMLMLAMQRGAKLALEHKNS